MKMPLVQMRLEVKTVTTVPVILDTLEMASLALVSFTYHVCLVLLT